MRAIIYTRGKDATEQEIKCRDYAAKHGLEIVAVASSVQEMEGSVFRRDADILLVQNVSRLTRRYQEFLVMEDILGAFGIKIEAVESR